MGWFYKLDKGSFVREVIIKPGSIALIIEGRGSSVCGPESAQVFHVNYRAKESTRPYWMADKNQTNKKYEIDGNEFDTGVMAVFWTSSLQRFSDCFSLVTF